MDPPYPLRPVLTATTAWRSVALALGVVAAGCTSDAAPAVTPDQREAVVDAIAPSLPDADAVLRFERAEVERERFVAACMATEEHLYFPSVGQDEAAADIDLRSREWAEEFGLGISTIVDLGVGSIDANPNFEYYSSLSDEGRAGYDAALGDCRATALAASDDPAVAVLLEQFEPQIAAVLEQVESDPRLIEADAAWAECMAEAGHDFVNREAMTADIVARLDLVLGAPAGLTEDLTAAEFDSLSDDELTELLSSGPEPDDEALLTLQDEERDLAVAAYTCGDGTEQFERRDRVTAEYIDAFIAENADEIADAIASG